MADGIVRILAGVVYLGGSAAIFIFGSSYYQLFRTNRSTLFRGALVLAFSVATWLLMRSTLDPAWGALSFAFLAAAIANLLGAGAASLQRPLGIKDTTLKGMALGKGLEAIVVVGSILALAGALRVPLGSLTLQTGRLGLGLATGLGGFALFALLAAGQARSMKIPSATVLRLLPWILVFVFANAFMEELWLRALFLGPLVSLIGPIAAIVLTGAVFALAHIGVSYMSGQERLRFLAILLPLGLAWGACIYFTGSVLASTLFHAGADLIIVNGFIADLHVEKPAEA